MKSKRNAFLLLLCLSIHTLSIAQTHTATYTFNRDLDLIDTAFQRGDTAIFFKSFPLENIQDLFRNVIRQRIKRKSGPHRIISMYADSAFAFVSGTFLYGNSGDETNSSVDYTGIYKFERSGNAWIVAEKIPIDRINKIKRQEIDVKIIPGLGITVSDTLTIDSQDPLGFAARFNHHAVLSGVTMNGLKTEYLFNGGLLYIPAKAKDGQKLVLNYYISIEKDDEDRNSGYFGEIFGHVRNQYCWHPFFSFSSSNDRADFIVRAAIPKDYGISTTLPQREQLIGETKIIYGKSDHPAFAIGLYYDKDWETKRLKKDQIELVMYTTKDFEPGAEKLYQEFSNAYDTLKSHFGKPIGDYLGIVQDRSGNGSGWKNRSNGVIVASAGGGYIITDKPNPRAIFGHEVAHQWTSPNGEATNFLTEGWATYAESLLLKAAYGDTIVTKFFKSQKTNYLNGQYDGKYSLSDDYANSGVSYGKGAWVFYLLEQQIGADKLAKALTLFGASGDQSIQSFTKQLSAAAGQDMAPVLNSWLRSRSIPVLHTKQTENTLTITQEADIFHFPLTIRVKFKSGETIDKLVLMNSNIQTVSFGNSKILSYTLDPEEKALFRVR